MERNTGHVIIGIADAIHALRSDFLGCKFVDEPTNETEYEAIEWVVGHDLIGSCIYGTRPSGVPDWATVKAKFDIMVSELAMSNLRAQRNILLAETDWSQGGDVPNTIKTKYNAYRQELRDLPEFSSPVWDNDRGILSNVTWPTKPS